MAKKTRKLFKRANSKNWKCQLQWRNDKGKLINYSKSLGTSDKALAWQRYDEIESKIDDLKEGLRFTWSWERKSQTSKIIIKTVQDAFDKYIEYQKTCELKPDTITGTKFAFNTFVKSNSISKSSPMKSLSQIEFDDYKEYWQGNHSPNYINHNINKIKAFLNFCRGKKWISDYKTITSTLKAKPISYFSDEEFKLVMDALESDELKRAMLFYHQTGCRKSEPFLATRVGNILIIPKMKKNKYERRVQLSNAL